MSDACFTPDEKAHRSCAEMLIGAAAVASMMIVTIKGEDDAKVNLHLEGLDQAPGHFGSCR